MFPSLRASVAIVLFCVAVCNSTLAADGLYAGLTDPLPVVTDTTVTLFAADAKRPVPLRIIFPREGGPYPLIVLSHGTFSANDRYDRIASYWAAQGYVIVLPQHIDSNYGVKPAGYAAMQNVAETRVADMSQVLDELDAIEARVPALTGKIARGRYVAAGHSIGTEAAMLVTGMQFKTSYSGELLAAPEARFMALVLISDPGKMRMMPPDTWLASNVPTFMATGTEDYGLMGQRGKVTEAQSDVLASTREVDRYELLLEGGDHYFGGLIQKDVEAQPDHEGLAIFNAVSTAFLDAYTKESATAQAYLRNVDMQQVTQQRARLNKNPVTPALTVDKP